MERYPREMDTYYVPPPNVVDELTKNTTNDPTKETTNDPTTGATARDKYTKPINDQTVENPLPSLNFVEV
jgi:hypothetical protein